MPSRHIPVRPDLLQLKHQAKELLRGIRGADPAALDDLRQFHPEAPSPASVKLADAQLVLARAYGIRSWPRLVLACDVTDAIWRDDIPALRRLMLKHPEALHEMATGVERSNWGPPLSYAANLGRDDMIEMLYQLGARDLMFAADRAALQSHTGTVRKIWKWLGSPRPPEDALGGPAYTLSVSGTQLMLEFGARVVDGAGRRLAPADVVLETDSRKPEAKHRILELYVEHGLTLPDTPVMALHRGRIDLLEEHLRRDPDLLRRRFTFEEIYPPEIGCHEDPQPTHGTPLGGTSLLHMCIDYDELEIAEWLLDRGADVNLKADVDADGFGGHTALFATVVSQPNFWTNRNGRNADSPSARMLLDRGADPNVRASLRKQLHPGYGPNPMHEYHDVTPLTWGERFHDRHFVSEAAMRLIEERGGGR